MTYFVVIWGLKTAIHDKHAEQKIFGKAQANLLLRKKSESLNNTNEKDWVTVTNGQHFLTQN